MRQDPVDRPVAKANSGPGHFVCEQPPSSIVARKIEADVLPTCQEFGMGAIVWSPLAGGWLSGRWRMGADD